MIEAEIGVIIEVDEKHNKQMTDAEASVRKKCTSVCPGNAFPYPGKVSVIYFLLIGALGASLAALWDIVSNSWIAYSQSFFGYRLL